MYSSSILSSPESIQHLASVIRRLPVDRPDTLREPEFFLSYASERWTPRLVSIQRADEIVGVVYARELRIGGLPVGLVFADASLTNIWVGDRERQDVFRVALETLLASHLIQGVRLRLLAHSPELKAVRTILSSRPLHVHFRRLNAHARLSLPRSYEEFLNRLNSETRRTFRRYTRRSEARGDEYLSELSATELRHAVSSLKGKSRRRAPTWATRRMLNMVAAAERPLRVGLKDQSGKWLSVAGGYYRSNSAILFFQLNADQEFKRGSISLVLRARLIRGLIELGHEELVFRGGVVPPLSGYCSPIRVIDVHLAKTALAGWLARAIDKRIGN